MRCGDNISDIFPVVTGVREWCELAPTLFITCMDWIMRRMPDRLSNSGSFGNVKISDLDFADDVVSFAETLDIFMGALAVLNEEPEPLGLRVYRVKTKIQASNDILDAAILSIPVCGEDVEVTGRFTYLGSDILVSADCEPEVNRHLGQAWSHGFTGLWGVALPVPVREDESLSLQVLGASSLALWM